MPKPVSQLDHLRVLLASLAKLDVDPVHIVYAPDARITVSIHLRSRTDFVRVRATRLFVAHVKESALGTARAERSYDATEPLIGGGLVAWHAYSTPRDSDWDASHNDAYEQASLL